MMDSFLFLPTPADAISPSLVVFIFLPLVGQLAVSNCETADFSSGNEITDLSFGHEISDLSAGNETADLGIADKTADFSFENETADLSVGNGTVLTAPPKSNELKNISARTGFDRNTKNKIIENNLKEHLERSNRLRIELENRNSPADLSLTFIEIADLEENIRKLKKDDDMPRNLRKVMTQMEEGLASLKSTAKTKLMVPLDKDIDKMLQDLKLFEAEGLSHADQKKLRVLQQQLRELKDELQRLNSSDDLNLVKRKVQKVLEGVEELKMAPKDVQRAQGTRRNAKRLQSGLSYYIVRYSVWIVPNKYRKNIVSKKKWD